VPPGQAYFKYVVHNLRHATVPASLKALLRAAANNADADDDNAGLAADPAAAVNIIAGFLEGLADAVNMLRVVLYRVVFVLMMRMHHFVVTKSFLAKAMKTLLDVDYNAIRRVVAPTNKRARPTEPALSTQERLAAEDEARVLDALREGLLDHEATCMAMWAGIEKPATEDRGEYLRELRRQGLLNAPGSFEVQEQFKSAARHVVGSYVVDEVRTVVKRFYDEERVARELVKTIKYVAREQRVGAQRLFAAVIDGLHRGLAGLRGVAEPQHDGVGVDVGEADGDDGEADQADGNADEVDQADGGDDDDDDDDDDVALGGNAVSCTAHTPS